MPTAVTHGFVGIIFGKIFRGSSSSRFWLFTIVCAILPDVDIIFLNLGVPLDHSFGHRGLSHSIFFALVIAIIVVLAGFREIKLNSKEWWQYCVYFFIIIISHDILDAMTSGGQGIAFLSPFDSLRYFLPFRPIRVSPLSIIRFFGSEGQKIIISEIIWIWIPAVILLVVVRLVKRRIASQSKKTLLKGTTNE